MGVPFRNIVSKREIDFSELKGKRLAFDGNNVLYQFLSAIRGYDGKPLTNDEGKITSHLVGLFSRITKLMEYGIRPVFVFDGKPLELKFETTEKRKEVKIKALENLKIATKEGNIEDMKKYSQQTSRLTFDMISEAKSLLKALGIPVIQAISDGEAQAAILAQKGSVFAVASQDYDSLLYGSPLVIRNLTISQRKKVAGTKTTTIVKPELINLNETLIDNEITRDQLINAAILIGTDFNSGIKGIGPKTALKIIREDRFEEYTEQIPRHNEVRNIFKNPVPVSDYNIKESEVNREKVIDILVNQNKFSIDRVNKSLDNLKKAQEKNKQSGLDVFI